MTGSRKTDFIDWLRRIGAIQFGHFEQRDKPGTFAPVAINLQLVPSYPAILRTLADELASLVRIDGITHLLAMPAVVPLATAVSLASGLPLVYPATAHPNTIEGAFDFNEPTVLLTDVLSDGAAERAFAKYVSGQGLDVKTLVAVIDLSFVPDLDFDIKVWQCITDILPQITTPSMQLVVQNWLTSLLT